MSSEAIPRPLIFGEVLYDRFPDGSVRLGGAPFNVAWHLQAFGAKPLLVSRVGDDPLGRGIRDTMLHWGMDTSGLQLDSAHLTGTVEVSITSGEPSFDIVEDRAYDFVDAGSLPRLDRPALLYHGSLALRNPVSAAACARLLERSGAPVLLDVNLRPPWWDRQSALEAVARARWVKLNEDELRQLGADGTASDAAASRFLSDNGLETLIVTRGGRGAQALSAGGEQASVAPAAQVEVVDTVGAGDAFASVFLLGLLRDWSLRVTLERAQELAAAIVGVRGATVQDRGFYAPFAARWA